MSVVRCALGHINYHYFYRRYKCSNLDFRLKIAEDVNRFVG